MLVPESIGPLVTLGAWLVLVVGIIVRNAIAAKRGDPHLISWFECVPVAGCLAMLQLLLDLLSPHAGDIAIAILHAPLVAIALWGLWRRAG